MTKDKVEDLDINVEDTPVITETPEVTEEPKVEAEPKTEKPAKADKEFERLVKETIRGAHGSGRERMISLGTNYFKVQQEITRRSRLASK